MAAIWFLFLEHPFRHAKLASIRAAEVDYVKQAGYALIRYTGDHKEIYPDFSGDMVATLRPYIKDPKLLEAMGRFVWNTNLSGKAETSLDDPSTHWVVYSKAPVKEESYAVGFADGHAMFSSPQFLDLILKGKAKFPWASTLTGEPPTQAKDSPTKSKK